MLGLLTASRRPPVLTKCIDSGTVYEKSIWHENGVAPHPSLAEPSFLDVVLQDSFPTLFGCRPSLILPRWNPFYMRVFPSFPMQRLNVFNDVVPLIFDPVRDDAHSAYSLRGRPARPQVISRVLFRMVVRAGSPHLEDLDQYHHLRVLQIHFVTTVGRDAFRDLGNKDFGLELVVVPDPHLDLILRPRESKGCRLNSSNTPRLRRERPTLYGTGGSTSNTDGKSFWAMLTISSRFAEQVFVTGDRRNTFLENARQGSR